MLLKGAVAIISGAGQGLGRGTAEYMAKMGAKVVIADINGSQVSQVAKEIGSSAIGCTVDVTDEAQVRAAMDDACNKWGKLDVAVSCAGILAPGRTLSKRGPMDLNKFANVMNVNVNGTFNVVRLAAEKMALNAPNENGERGVIVNTSSIAYQDGQIGQVAYAASKGAIASMTLPIARDLASQGIRICALAPGIFMTPMMAELTEDQVAALCSNVPFPSRLGQPEEFAQMVESIVTNPMLNGEVIRLDAALRMQPK